MDLLSQRHGGGVVIVIAIIVSIPAAILMAMMTLARMMPRTFGLIATALLAKADLEFIFCVRHGLRVPRREESGAAHSRARFLHNIQRVRCCPSAR